jgi:signal transduction histidine kinase
MAASVRPEEPNRRGRTARSGELVALRDDLAGLLAHDLKTPLAAISMNLDFVLDELGKQASGAMRGALEDCRSANARAIRIVSDMADAVRLVSGEKRATLTDVDVSALLGNLVRAAAPEAAARGVRMVWHADSDMVRADADLLSRALDRLLERALRHARTGGAVEITLRAATVTMSSPRLPKPRCVRWARTSPKPRSARRAAPSGPRGTPTGRCCFSRPWAVESPSRRERARLREAVFRSVLPLSTLRVRRSVKGQAQTKSGLPRSTSAAAPRRLRETKSDPSRLYR